MFEFILLTIVTLVVIKVATIHEKPYMQYYLKHMIIVIYANFVSILLIPVFAMRPRNVSNLK